ncbi:MAG: endolytic transglycosylase MltG [Candidatus Taylorbacteria bacterium]
MPRPHNKKIYTSWKIPLIIFVCLLGAGICVFTLPTLLTWEETPAQTPTSAVQPEQFPISVDPIHKTIKNSPEIEAYFTEKTSALEAAAGDSDNFFVQLFHTLALSIANAPWYQNLASVSGIPTHSFIVINPGLRKEQVALVFARALHWNTIEQKSFLAPRTDSTPSLSEGSFAPGTYIVDSSADSSTIQSLVQNRFSTDILQHYGTTTQAIVPLDQALTIASLIQRETIGTKDMRLISGIIWNRIFAGMNLQLDSTLQYAKATKQSTALWWPPVSPRDKYIKSPYNTYLNNGLPPTPIASPSVEAVLATLNPIKTDCLFYFHDSQGNFHCSKTYEQHKALIDKYY